MVAARQDRTCELERHTRFDGRTHLRYRKSQHPLAPRVWAPVVTSPDRKLLCRYCSLVDRQRVFRLSDPGFSDDSQITPGNVLGLGICNGLSCCIDACRRTCRFSGGHAEPQCRKCGRSAFFGVVCECVGMCRGRFHEHRYRERDAGDLFDRSRASVDDDDRCLPGASSPSFQRLKLQRASQGVGQPIVPFSTDPATSGPPGPDDDHLSDWSGVRHYLDLVGNLLSDLLTK